MLTKYFLDATQDKENHFHFSSSNLLKYDPWQQRDPKWTFSPNHAKYATSWGEDDLPELSIWSCWSRILMGWDIQPGFGTRADKEIHEP